MRTGSLRGSNNSGISRRRDVSTPDVPKIVDQIFTLACVHFGVPRTAKSPDGLSGGGASFGVSQRKQVFAWVGSVKRPIPQKNCWIGFGTLN